ncbi:hypothetical protein ACQI4F_04260 [Mycolicibacterium vaccae]|uniref:hypothetical protein n=1 Tax=Mycolicibacterium vaccae TaxID=1810 RepID=UPI003CF6DDE1
MADGTTHADDPFNEAVATTGLFLLMSAVIALAVALASWGMSETLIAGLSGVAALLSFGASIFCFRMEATEVATAEASA